DLLVATEAMLIARAGGAPPEPEQPGSHRAGAPHPVRVRRGRPAPPGGRPAPPRYGCTNCVWQGVGLPFPRASVAPPPPGRPAPPGGLPAPPRYGCTICVWQVVVVLFPCASVALTRQRSTFPIPPESRIVNVAPLVFTLHCRVTCCPAELNAKHVKSSTAG